MDGCLKRILSAFKKRRHCWNCRAFLILLAMWFVYARAFRYFQLTLRQLYFPGLFAGPSFDYVDYRRWIDTTLFEVPSGTNPAHAPKTRKQRKIPRSGTPAAWKAITGVVWLVLFLIFSGWYNFELVLGDEYLKYGFLRRVWILEILGFVSRMRYYGVWYITEGACILSGLGYRGINPQTGHVQWDRLQNVRPWGIESAQNTQAYLGNWNINTNLWLRNYMYLRVTPKGKKPGFRASLATFATSAFWHGFYPGYYLAFILAAFLQTIAKSRFPPFFFCPTRLTRQQMSAATSAPSSSLLTAPGPRPTNPITTLSPTSPPKLPSASPPYPSCFSASALLSLSGPASTFMPSLAPPQLWLSSLLQGNHGSIRNYEQGINRRSRRTLRSRAEDSRSWACRVILRRMWRRRLTKSSRRLR